MSERVLVLHERTRDDGSLSPISLRRDGDRLELLEDGVARPLPSGAVEAVVARYGSSFDTAARVREVRAIDLGAGATLRHVRHLGAFDVIAKDYLVLHREGQAPLFALSTIVCDALRQLAVAFARTLEGGAGG